MAPRARLTIFLLTAFGVGYVAINFPQLPTAIKGVMLVSAGWLLTASCWFQMKLHADIRDAAYYAMVVLTGFFVLLMTGLITFYLYLVIREISM